MKRLSYILLLVMCPLSSLLAQNLMISTAEELQAFATRVNGGTSYAGRTVYLTADINMPSVAVGEANLTPIGTVGHPFEGTFDGLGHKISNLEVSIAGSETGNVAGLFGCIAASGIVRRVGVESGNIVLTSKTSSDVACFIGGIAGQNLGVIQQCYNKATIYGSLYMAHAGGIVGINGDVEGVSSPIIEDCYNQGDIYASESNDNYLGGIAGESKGTIRRVYSSGTVSEAAYYGAIYGVNNGTVTDAYSSGLKGDALNGKLNTLNDFSIWTFAADEYPTLTCFGSPITMIGLSDNADNSSTLTTNNGRTVDVMLTDRTLYKDGNWNTLCLPFDVTISGSVLDGDGVSAKVLDGSSSSLDGEGTLTLAFDAAGSTISAGTPFIIKWNEEGTDLVNPEFRGVVINNGTPTAETFSNAFGDDGSFVGTYSPFSITEENIDNIVMLSGDNKLGYSNKTRTLRSFRAHFEIPTTTAGVRAMSGFSIDFGDGEVTGIESIENEKMRDGENEKFFDLSGRRLNERSVLPKGVYIVNGKKMLIK